jgi:hypothetical protein
MFRFSLSNLMLMMVPLAAAFACIGYAAMRDPLFAYGVAAPISLVLAVPTAIGALRRGWYGMGVGFALGWVLFTVLTLLFGVLAGTFRV